MTLRARRAVGAPVDGTVMSGPPPQMSDIAWFARIASETRGPFTEDEVVRLFHEGELGSHTALWHDAMDDWARLVDVPDFAVLFTPRRRVKAKTQRPPDSGTVVDFMRATEPITQDGSHDLLDDDEEIDGDPTDPYDVLDRSDIEGEPISIDFDRSSELERTARAFEDELYLSADANEAISAPPTPPDETPSPTEGTDQYVAASGIGRSRLRLVIGLAAAGVLIVGAIAVLALVSSGAEPEEVAVRPVGDTEKRPRLLASMDTVQSGVDVACLAEGSCPPPEEEADSVALTVRTKGATGPVSDPEKAAQIRELLGASSTSGPAILRKGPSVTPQVSAQRAIVPDASELSAEDVQLIVARGVNAVQFCVDRESMVQGVSGRQVLRLTVTAAGHVAAARFENRVLNASPLGECVVRAANRWRFPAFAGEPVDVRVPLVLGG
jgi:hypothetical protein